jgi:hypothetical protein
MNFLLDVMEEILSLCDGGVDSLEVVGMWWWNMDRVVGWAHDSYWVVFVVYFIQAANLQFSFLNHILAFFTFPSKLYMV